MKLLRFLFVLLLPIVGFSQIQGEDEVYLDGDLIEAKFNGGGLDKFGEFINQEFNYSKVGKPGTMVAAFTIDEEGNVKGIKIVQVLDIESATEIIRVLKKCPKWQPAKRGGKPISIEIKYPIIFKERQHPQKSETITATSSTVYEGEIFKAENVEQKPMYGGGLKGFFKFISTNFHVPDIEGFKGKILVAFVIETDGSLSDIKVIKDLGYGTAQEAIRVLKLCPKWQPALQDGKPVRVEYSLPITISSM